jgi:response regulator of citrate/malate metabolism
VVRFRDLQRSLGGVGSIPDQQQLDRIFGASSAQRPIELPKGLLAETLVQVRDALDAADHPLSARETADVTGLSRVTARRYLEHLVDTGQASRQSRHGAQGRPELEYVRPRG